MHHPKQWSFKGMSETTYQFEVYTMSSQLPEAGGIYILGYSHPRGHLAGFQVNILCMGETDNFRLTIKELRHQQCLIDECWNYSYILPLDSPEAKAKCLSELRNNNPTRC